MSQVEFVNDNLHGRIELSCLEKDIVKTPTFLRLGRIQQLGLASMVFPGATHTRLSHSLGVLHIMTQIVRRLGLEGDEPKKLRLAALLHDIGQYPLSHVIESVYRKIGDTPENLKDVVSNYEILKELKSSDTILQFAAGEPTGTDDARDKAIAVEVIKHRPDLQAVFLKHDIDEKFIDEVVKIIKGEHESVLFRHLMDSDYDCDRLDYVGRDAYLTGVQYGKIDLAYLIENFSCPVFPPTSTERVLAINKRRALHTFEHYLTARYYMYSQIIYHKTVKSLELIAKAIFLQLADKKDENGIDYIYNSYKKIIEIIPSDEFLFFDDTYFYKKIFEYYQQPDSDDSVKKLIGRLIKGESLTMIQEYRMLQNEDQDIFDIKYITADTLLNKSDMTLKEICSNAYISRNQVVIDKPKPLKFVPIGQLTPTTQLNIEETEKNILNTPRLFNEDTGETELIIEDKSSIINKLSGFELHIMRIYLDTENETEKDLFLQELNKKIDA